MTARGERPTAGIPRDSPVVVGIVNVTPDSFSDGGNFLSPDAAASHAARLLDEGADVVEVGGESSRPGAAPVPVADEIARAIPAIREIMRRRPEARVAVDTVKSEVARAALDAGATIVNDVSALRLDPAMAAVCAAARCTVILMHSRGSVAEMASYAHARYHSDPVGEIVDELRASSVAAMNAGIARERIVLDPGIGFSKRSEQSLAVLAQLGKIAQLGFPVMVGVSRKRLIGELTRVHQAVERDEGSVGANVAALTLGASWFRVHAVRANRHALDVAAAILGGCVA